MADHLEPGGQAWLSCLPRVVKPMSHWKGQVRLPGPQRAGPWQGDDFIVSGKPISSGSLLSACTAKGCITSFTGLYMQSGRVKESVNRVEGPAGGFSNVTIDTPVTVVVSLKPQFPYLYQGHELTCLSGVRRELGVHLPVNCVVLAPPVRSHFRIPSLYNARSRSHFFFFFF